MDRLGHPYKAGKKCDSCPKSCEEATWRHGGNIMDDFNKITAILGKDRRSLKPNLLIPSENKIVCEKMHLKWEKVSWVTYVFNTILI